MTTRARPVSATQVSSAEVYFGSTAPVISSGERNEEARVTQRTERARLLGQEHLGRSPLALLEELGGHLDAVGVSDLHGDARALLELLDEWADEVLRASGIHHERAVPVGLGLRRGVRVRGRVRRGGARASRRAAREEQSRGGECRDDSVAGTQISHDGVASFVKGLGRV